MTPEQQFDADLWRSAVARRIDGLETRLDENTETTKRIEANTTEMVEIFNSWKGAMKVLEFLGKVSKWLMPIVTLCAAIFAFKGTK